MGLEVGLGVVRGWSRGGWLEVGLGVVRGWSRGG